MKNILFKGLVLFVFGLCLKGSLIAQKSIQPSDSIRINGVVEKSYCYKISELDTFKMYSIPDQILYNHKGEIKDTARHLKGIKLKDLLKKVKLLLKRNHL